MSDKEAASKEQARQFGELLNFQIEAATSEDAMTKGARLTLALICVLDAEGDEDADQRQDEGRSFGQRVPARRGLDLEVEQLSELPRLLFACCLFIRHGPPNR